MHPEQLPDVLYSPSYDTANGKLQCLPPVAMVAGSRLLHFQDRASGRSFLIDTGAEVSLIPASPADNRAAIASAHSAPLAAANGTEIKSYGTRRIPLQFGNKHFQGSFIVADINQAILGADFLRDNGLLVDLGGQRLVHSATYNNIAAPSMVCQPLPLAVIKTLQVSNIYDNLLASRPKLTELSFRKDRVLSFVLILASLLLSSRQPGACLPRNSVSHTLPSKRWKT